MIANLRKDGFGLARETLDPKTDAWLDGMFVEEIRKSTSSRQKKSRSSRRKRSQGGATYRPQGGGRSKSRLHKLRGTAALELKRQMRRQNINRAFGQPAIKRVDEVEEELSPMPNHFEAWVDEDGVRVWRDKNSGRTLNSDAVRNPRSDPYTSWVKVIDPSGRELYVREETGEAVVGQDVSNDSETPSISTTEAKAPSGKSVRRRSSLPGRAVHKISKWISKRVGGMSRNSGEFGRSRSVEDVVLRIGPENP